jgi:hypothetical protein
MKTRRPNAVRPADQIKRNRAVRPPIEIASWIICLVCLGAVVVVHFARDGANQRVKGRPPAMTRAAPPAKSPRAAVARSTAPRQSESVNEAAASRQTRIGKFASYPEPTPATRQWVSSLVYVNAAGGALTDEQAAAWKKNFQELVQQGVVAVPAIREFLEKNVDLVFGPDGSELLGYASARMAMIDALTQIGSPVAETALDELLQNTADPREIAQVAQGLEKLEPGVYQRDALDAARQALVMAAKGNLPDLDVAPLFQVLQQYGGADAVADLEGSVNQWNYYAAITLAQLPDGAGIPSLIQVATGQAASSPSARTATLEMLAAVASQSTEARDALVDQARQNKLSPYDWATLVPFLAGNQMVFQNSVFGNVLSAVNPNDLRKTMISASNQSFYTAPLAALTTGQINQQQALIERLLSVTTDPGGIQALQQSKALLENRLGLLANSSVN